MLSTAFTAPSCSMVALKLFIMFGLKNVTYIQLEAIFPKIKDMAPEEQQEARKALLEYCHLDTLAMVKIWEKLEEVSR